MVDNIRGYLERNVEKHSIFIRFISSLSRKGGDAAEQVSW
jgi:hypothetical protein